MRERRALGLVPCPSPRPEPRPHPLPHTVVSVFHHLVSSLRAGSRWGTSASGVAARAESSGETARRGSHQTPPCRIASLADSLFMLFAARACDSKVSLLAGYLVRVRGVKQCVMGSDECGKKTKTGGLNDREHNRVGWVNCSLVYDEGKKKETAVDRLSYYRKEYNSNNITDKIFISVSIS